MKLKTFAFFESAFPDDSVEADGEIVVPDGRTLMEAIFNLFQQAGYQPTNFDQHSQYGWAFDVSGNEGAYWLLIQCPGPWLLTVHDSRMPWTRLIHGTASVRIFLEQCDTILLAIPQLSDVRWLTEKELTEQMWKR